MRHVGLLLKHVGDATENPRDEVTSTAGISDDEIIEYLGDGQSRVQEVVLRDLPHFAGWDTYYEQDIVAATQEYSISPGDAFYLGSVREVRYSPTGVARDFRPLAFLEARETGDFDLTYISAYSLRGGEIIVDGVPGSSSGSLRSYYVRRLDKLDKRRGKIASVAGAAPYTTITLEDDTDLDETNIALYDYLCVNSAQGVVTYYNAPYVSYDTSTKVLTFDSGVTSSVGTIAVGSYITLGKYTTTHSKLPDECEKYLMAYAKWKMFKRDSSDDAAEQNAELVAMEDAFLTAFNNNVLDLRNQLVSEPEWFF